MQIRSVGIDLGKTSFHLVALGDNGKVLLKKKFSQKQLITFTATLQTSLIGMEACSGAHFLARALRAQGHDVKLIPAQFVKPFVKSNKNDFLDAEAIAEAVDRHNMRFVPIKTDDQLDLQALHRVRDRLMIRRTSVINQIRAFLLERGMVFAKSPIRLREAIPEVLENANENLTPSAKRHYLRGRRHSSRERTGANTSRQDRQAWQEQGGGFRSSRTCSLSWSPCSQALRYKATRSCRNVTLRALRDYFWFARNSEAVRIASDKLTHGPAKVVEGCGCVVDHSCRMRGGRRIGAKRGGCGVEF